MTFPDINLILNKIFQPATSIWDGFQHFAIQKFETQASI